MRTTPIIALFCLLAGTAAARAETLRDMLDLARHTLGTWRQSHESRTADRVLAVLDDAEAALELAAALGDGVAVGLMLDLEPTAHRGPQPLESRTAFNPRAGSGSATTRAAGRRVRR